MKKKKLPIKQIVAFAKGIVVLTLIFVVIGLCYIHRDYLWQMSGVARSYYYVWMGDESLKKGKFQEAIDNYKTALHIYPEHVKAHYNLGNIYYAYELYSSPAENNIVRIYKYDIQKEKYILSSEQIKKISGFDENNAESSYLAAIKQDPNFQNAYINLGLIKSSQFDYDAAISYFSKAINSRPRVLKIPYIFDNSKAIKENKAVAWYNLGNAYFHKAVESENNSHRNFWIDKSLNALMNSYKINNHSYKTNYNLANTYQILKKDSNAITHYCKAIKIDPQKYEPHYNLGVLFMSKRNYLASSDEIKKAAFLIDIGKYNEKSNYIFTILTDIGNRAAAHVLYERDRYAESTVARSPEGYPAPTKGIIYDVLFAKPEDKSGQSISDDLSDQNMSDNSDLDSKNAGKNHSGNLSSKQEKKLNESLSSCYTDPEYSTKLYETYTKSPQWIYLDKSPKE